MADKKHIANLAGFVILVIFMISSGLFKDNKPSAPQSSSSSSQSVPEGRSTIPKGPWPAVESDQTIEVAADPLGTNYYVILDTSGSMKNTVAGRVKIDAAKDALKVFSENLPEEANLGLATFSPVGERVPIGTQNRPDFVRAVDAASARGQTPLIQSIDLGFKALTAQALKQSGYGRYILVIVTDGESSDGDPQRIARDVVKHSAIEVQVVGFGLKNHALNIPGFTEYYVADSIDSLIKALKSIVSSESEDFVDPTDFSSSI